MISHPAFPVEAWELTETSFSPEVLAQTETIFSLANGYLGMRGNLDEGAPVAAPGTYLNGFHECRPILYAERYPGFPLRSETMLNVTDGKIIVLTVDGEPLDIRTGQLHRHVRVLDLRNGILTRSLRWTAPGGAQVEVTSRRLVSLARPHLAAVDYRVSCVNRPARLGLRSALMANESIQLAEDDPRESAPLYGQVLLPQLRMANATRAVMVHVTRSSRLAVAAGMEHRLETADPAELATNDESSAAWLEVAVEAEVDHPVRLVKLLAFHWSAHLGAEDLAGEVDRSLDTGAEVGFDGLAAEQERTMTAFWDRTDVEVDGDAEVQQGVRFGLFQMLQASAHAGRRGVAAKGLSGQGYEGHRFWDTEVFLLPPLAYTTPAWARDLLAFRHGTLDRARSRATELGLRGALYPWRTISGTDVSPYFPAGVAGYHLVADIAHAVGVYATATGDEDFLMGPGAEMLVETARLWMSLGHHDPARDGAFCIERVTGPDEYSALVDNNVYTNVMAAANLRAAADVAERLRDERPDDFRTLVEATGVDETEMAAWRRAADAVYLPYDDERGIHSQDETFLHLAPWEEERDPEQGPLLLRYHPLTLYQHQVVKQADLVLALQLAADRFGPDEQRRDFAYYEPITVHDSTLSAATHAVVAARLDHLDQAVRYLRATALVDLDDLAHNLASGLHVAALCGAWSALVAGLAGFRHDAPDVVRFDPRLPPGWRRLAFPLTVRGRRLDTEITPTTTSYRLDPGEPLVVVHHGHRLTVAGGRVTAVPTTPHRDRRHERIGGVSR